MTAHARTTDSTTVKTQRAPTNHATQYTDSAYAILHNFSVLCIACMTTLTDGITWVETKKDYNNIIYNNYIL